MNNLLTAEEVKTFLELDQEQLEKHLKDGKLHAYKIGGTYLRFRKDEVLTLRTEATKKLSTPVSIVSRIGDFWRFNNFYIISLLIVIGLIVFVSKI